MLVSGHCVCYQGPSVFTTVFNAVKSLIDTRTRSKVIFLTGDVSDGSVNDVLMRSVIGDNWKLLTGLSVSATYCSSLLAANETLSLHHATSLYYLLIPSRRRRGARAESSVLARL